MITSEVVGDLSLIVVSYHRPEALDRLLISAKGQAAQVIVVNVDDDPVIAKVSARHEAKVVPLGSNPGYAAAVNAGVAAVSTPLVAFANDDLELAPGCMAYLVLELQAGADVAVPRLCRPDGHTEPSIARLVTPGALACEWVALPDGPRLPSSLPVSFPISPCRSGGDPGFPSLSALPKRRWLLPAPLSSLTCLCPRSISFTGKNTSGSTSCAEMAAA